MGDDSFPFLAVFCSLSLLGNIRFPFGEIQFQNLHQQFERWLSLPKQEQTKLQPDGL
jgi:hypothetical protein